MSAKSSVSQTARHRYTSYSAKKHSKTPEKQAINGVSVGCMYLSSKKYKLERASGTSLENVVFHSTGATPHL